MTDQRVFLPRGYYTLLRSYYEFDKNANSIGMYINVPRIDIVWRLSGFAFFVRLLR